MNSARRKVVSAAQKHCTLPDRAVCNFLLCGDPREGIARYECPQCKTSVAVPFSCKTRLFCPTCHEIKTLVWIDTIQAGLLLPLAHRFFSFSIPKRLRFYFMRNRKLLSLLVTAATNALVKSLADGKLRANFRPGIVPKSRHNRPINTQLTAKWLHPHLTPAVLFGILPQ